MKRKTIFILLIFLISSFFLIWWLVKNKKGGEQKMTDFKGKKILMVVAPHNFRDEEFLEPKKIFEREGIKAVVASKGVEEVQGMFGTKIKPEIDLTQVRVEEYEGIVFVGGTGTVVYFNDPIVLDLAKKAAEMGKVIGAICIAPSILANAGVLEGKKATVFPSESDNLKNKGAILTSEPVVEDGNIITANGPQAAEKFGEMIVKKLK